MFKLSKKSDYGLIAIKHLATHGADGSCSAGEIAELYEISTPLMAKVLQRLAKQGLVAARHGSSGGDQVGGAPGRLTPPDLHSANDGPPVITSCLTRNRD